MQTTYSYDDRVDRLYAGKAKLEARHKHTDDRQKKKALEARIAEYAVSIDRIKKGLPEHSTRDYPRPDRERPTGRFFGRKTDTVVGVPKDHMGVREN
jgi:hypothetical protein